MCGDSADLPPTCGPVRRNARRGEGQGKGRLPTPVRKLSLIVRRRPGRVCRNARARAFPTGAALSQSGASRSRALAGDPSRGPSIETRCCSGPRDPRTKARGSLAGRRKPKMPETILCFGHRCRPTQRPRFRRPTSELLAEAPRPTRGHDCSVRPMAYSTALRASSARAPSVPPP